MQHMKELNNKQEEKLCSRHQKFLRLCTENKKKVIIRRGGGELHNEELHDLYLRYV
jgi:hypothetical protein